MKHYGIMKIDFERKVFVMKDTQKILDRLKLQAGYIEGINEAETIQEGIRLIALEIIKTGNKDSIYLFKKFGNYIPEYVEKELPLFCTLLSSTQPLQANQKEQQPNASYYNENSTGRLVGYCRPLAEGSSIEEQKQQLNKAGCTVLYTEKSNNYNRVAFTHMINELNSGDTLMVCEATVLCFSISELFDTISVLHSKGIRVISLADSWLNTKDGVNLNIDMKIIACLDKKLKVETEKQQLESAKAKGSKYTKKLQPNADLEKAILLVKEGKYTTTQIAQMTNISRTTLWRKLKELDLK